MRHPILLWALIVAYACSDDATVDAGRDGISIDTVPIVDIADVNPEADPVFEWPAGGTRFSNGNVLIVDAWGSRVLLFDSTGRVLRTIGSPGSGPGEYGTVIWDGLCAPDTAFVVDQGQMRRDVIDAQGNVVRTERVEPHNSFHGCAVDGSTYSWDSELAGLPSADDPPLRGELTLGRIGSEEERPVGEFDTWKYGPLRQRTSVALTSAGFALATGASGAIELYDRSGAHLHTIETGLGPRASTDAMYDASLERFVEGFSGRDDRQQLLQMIAERFPMPAETPAYQEVRADPRDLLWVVSTFPGEGHTTFEIFDLTGARRGSVRVPVDLTVFEVGETHLLGRYLDRDGVPHVALYRLSRS